MKKNLNNPISLDYDRLLLSNGRNKEISKNLMDNSDLSKEKTDSTLLFMTLAVTLTDQNEMPLVSPYTGQIPDNILGIYRLNDKYLIQRLHISSLMTLVFFTIGVTLLRRKRYYRTTFVPLGWTFL